jgi:hypothetical protein
MGRVSTKLQYARSNFRMLITDGKLRASRISSCPIRISEVNLQVYLDGLANMSAPSAPATRSARTNRP